MNTQRSRTPESGFTLAELAIALLILTLLTTGAISAIRVQQERSTNSETKTVSLGAQDAVLMFAATHGRLPCPASLTEEKNDSDGIENCLLHYGSIPWFTLALDGKGRDAQGRPLRYMVSTSFKKTGFSLVSNGDTHIINTKDQDLVDHKSVAFVLWGIGADARNATSPTQTSNHRVVAEAKCDGPNTTPQPDPSTPETGHEIEIAAATTCEVDDLVSWTSRFLLLARLRETGWFPEVSQSTPAPESSTPR